MGCFRNDYILPFKLADGLEYMLPNRGVKLIGIKFYPYDGECSADREKAMCMQKSLYGKKDWLYFNEGFNISEVAEGKIQVEVDSHAFDSSFLLYTDANIGMPVLSVGAVVGQNGTGKSTIIDTVVRLLNNLSAAILGEDYVYSSAQHLHYIDNVYASLAVYVDSSIKILTCKGRKLYVATCVTNANELDNLYAANNDIIERYFSRDTTCVLDGSSSRSDLLPAQEKLRDVLEGGFYTLVSNYSLYAYNYRDYGADKTDEERLKKLSGYDANNDEDKFWLKGVFHKNDGYQTPVVIHPMRENGFIDAAKVNFIGKQNLISLCFIKDESAKNDDGKFPFRTINQTHHIVEFRFYLALNWNFEYEVKEFLKDRCSETFGTDKACNLLLNSIKEFWQENIGDVYQRHEPYDLISQAWDYIVYKTIKVIWTYSQYKGVKEHIERGCDSAILKQDLQQILMDSSHRTLKIRRTVCYLRFYQDDDYYMNHATANLDDMYEWMQKKIGQHIYPAYDYHSIAIEDLLPVSFVNVILRLVDNKHWDNYKKTKEGGLDIIPFGGLSSGERQIAYTIGNIIYHLKNIESNYKDMNADKAHLEGLKYKYVNVMLDEVELYFHPDLQRRFVSLLLDSIRTAKLSGLSGINVTLVTHSPFVLSDIPRDNILCLAREKEKTFYDKTFAANIHDLFNNTFILPCTIGEYAQRQITELLREYNRIRRDPTSNVWRIHVNPSKMESNLMRYRYLSDIIGDEYLSEEVTSMIEEMESKIIERRGKDEED